MFDDFDAFDAGTAYALMRHGQDRQARTIIGGLAGRQGQQQQAPDGTQPIEVHVHLGDEDDPNAPLYNNIEFSTADVPEWDDYVGQEPLKLKLKIAIESAKRRGVRLPHVLLASGVPGVGKTTMARLIAKQMGVRIFELVPPFNVYTFAKAAEKLDDHDILFIDEIHKLADRGKAQAESVLLKALEEGMVFLPDGTLSVFSDITIIGATTDADKLPEPVVDRFKIKPYFQTYSEDELVKITVEFAIKHDCLDELSAEVLLGIAEACRGTPRICEEFVIGARDLGLALNRPVTNEELRSFMEVTPDGLTRQHVHYITALYQYFKRQTKDGTWEYVVGEAAMMQILRETKPGMGRIERFLVERGLVDRTPRGRRLTDRGIERAQKYVAQGLGASDVA